MTPPRQTLITVTGDRAGVEAADGRLLDTMLADPEAMYYLPNGEVFYMMQLDMPVDPTYGPVRVRFARR